MKTMTRDSSSATQRAVTPARMLSVTLTLALAVLLLVTLGACDIRPPGSPDVPVAGQADSDSADDSCCDTDGNQSTPDDDVTDDADTDADADAGTVIVPPVLGMWPDEAAEILEAAGLTAEEIDVHGPIDPDAGNIGVVYRQTPAAGAEVPAGTVVEIRSWWESQ